MNKTETPTPELNNPQPKCVKRAYVKRKPETKTGNKPRRADADKSVKPRARRMSTIVRRGPYRSIGGYGVALAARFAEIRKARPKRRRVTGAQKRKAGRGLHR